MRDRTEDVETVLTTGSPGSDEYRLLVAVRAPDTVAQLMRTATDLARLRGGSVHVVSVVHKPYESPFRLFDDETIRAEFAGDRRAILDRAVEAGEDASVEVTGSVVVSRSIADGILRTARSVDADALLVGWQQPGRHDGILGTTVDTLVERARTDVIAEYIGRTADGVESVLVPIVDGPHAAFAAETGYAIAAANDARLVLLSVTGGDTDRTTAHERLRSAKRSLVANAGGAETVEAEPAGDARSIGESGTAGESPIDDGIAERVIDDDDVATAIVSEATDHDIVAMGATRGGTLRRRLVGSIPQQVARRTDRTVLLTRRWTNPSRAVQLLGRIRRSRY